MEHRTMAKRTMMPIDGRFRVRSGDGAKRIEGYFATFQGEYVYPYGSESVDPHAFDDCLGDDIRCLTDHDTRLVLGRTKAGTLELRVDEKGLWGSVLINEEDSDAMNLYARVERGDVSQCSFGFDILDEEYQNLDDGTVHCILKKVQLYEVSCVTFPAYQDTSIEARAQDFARAKKRALAAWQASMRKRIKRSEN